MAPQTPTSPNQQYDFISKTNQPVKRRFNLPVPDLPKPVLIILGLAVALIVLFAIIGIISSAGKSSNNEYFTALARAEEISRVSQEVEGLSKDPNTQNLASTTNNTLLGGQKMLTDYLNKSGTKVSSATLSSDMSKTTDSQMQTAVTNNSLDAVFAAYLRTQLGKYRSDLQAAYKIAGPHEKTILSAIDSSVKVIVSTLPAAPAS